MNKNLKNRIAFAVIALFTFSSNVFSYPQKALRDVSRVDDRSAVTLLKKRMQSKINHSPRLINRLRLIFSFGKTKKIIN